MRHPYLSYSASSFPLTSGRETSVESSDLNSENIRLPVELRMHDSTNSLEFTSNHFYCLPFKASVRFLYDFFIAGAGWRYRGWIVSFTVDLCRSPSESPNFFIIIDGRNAEQFFLHLNGPLATKQYSLNRLSLLPFEPIRCFKTRDGDITHSKPITEPITTANICFSFLQWRAVNAASEC